MGSTKSPLWSFINLLRVEPYLFVCLFVQSVKKVPQDQLIQDKICRQKYNQSFEYCFNLPTMKAEDDIFGFKSKILADVSQFNLYGILITTIPSVIISLFFGSWTDKYPMGRKVLMCSCAVGGFLDAVLLVWNSIQFDLPYDLLLLVFVPPGVLGGMIGCYTAIWSHVAATTPPKLRAIRMTLLEICIFTGTPVGTAVAGRLIKLDPIGGNGQLRNYVLVFMLSGLGTIFAITWAYFMVKINPDSISQSSTKNNTELEDVQSNEKNKSNMSVNDMNSKTCLTPDGTKNIEDENPLKLLFDLKNLKEIFITCIKGRKNHVRTQIWLLFLSMICFQLSHIGPQSILFQFAQRVYEWDAETFSYASSIGYVAVSVCMLCGVPILVKVLKVKDTTLALLGILSYFSQNMLRASILSPAGFFISLASGSLGGMTAVGIRAHFSKIVLHQELGKIFSILSSIDVLSPLLAQALFTLIFNATMDTTPGTCFYVNGGLLLIPFLVFSWIIFYTKIPVLDVKKESNETANEPQSRG